MGNGPALLDSYFSLREEVFGYFGYVEDWKAIPLEDSRERWWSLDQNPDGSGTVYMADSREQLVALAGDHYSSGIYTQCFLPKWVYRGEDLTIICTDPKVDLNKFLEVFSNDREVPLDELDQTSTYFRSPLL